jgi:cyclopropane fatty-acyl-phospholipid synthase-like methyltransferase
LKPGRFVEIGPGAGHTSGLLLSLGWRGIAYDLEPSTVAVLERRFASEIVEGRYSVVNDDWLETDRNDQFDLVLSCMVMEHLDAEGERAFVERALRSLRADGRLVSIVPASPEHWGIEDEIAGHFRRYTVN